MAPGPDPGGFRKGAFGPARVAGVPVVPVAIVGTADGPAENARRFHRAPMRLEFGEPWYFAQPEEARGRGEGVLRRDDMPQYP
ncbi:MULTISPECIES: hypothetical protein [Streptomyces]|uniref:Uncharacterized protein n=1 Tax=Streptomyces fimbriatus TaxID=68197 RepID=A0ABW0D251_STRFI